MLKIDNIEFSYQEIKVLKKIDLYIEKQDFLGIIGPNGSGKSTLLKNISNILSPDTGVIYLDKKSLNNYDAKKLAQKMAVVPQDTMVNFNFTVYDLIMMGRNPYQDRWGRITEEDKQIVSESMQLTDTDKFKTKNINELSGGERQRVIIARAIAQKPEILLLDEPTASLDINYQGEIFDLISYLNKELKITVVTVSHDLNLTSQYCDELILLNKGKIFAAGAPEIVLTRENISKVYHAEVIIKENPLTERPYVTLVPRSYRKALSQTTREKIHVICGGGSGKELLERLYLEGFQLSCGVINKGDSDWEMAKKLEIDLVEIPPFAYIDQEHYRQNQVLLEKADIIIVADTPFGHGNLDNLKLVTEASEKPVILLDCYDFKERDYTEGKATGYWQKILDRGNSYCVVNNNELIEKVRNLSREKNL